MQVAIKKVLQDKRFKNRELQIMKMMGHPNVVDLKHCFYTNTDKDEVRHLLMCCWWHNTVAQCSLSNRCVALHLMGVASESPTSFAV